MSARLGNHPALGVIVTLFVLLATTYSVVTPIFEAGDEVWHYPVVRQLASGRGLPIQDPSVKTLWEQEGGQPPLYYAIAALATFWIDTRDLEERRWMNPHARIGIPLLYGNKNLIVHTSAEDFPWRGTTLAVHLIRFLSIFFAAMAVALTYLLALEIAIARSVLRDEATLGPHASAGVSKSSWGLLRFARNDTFLTAASAAFVAFNPMFLFISASVNNDSLAVLLATLSLLLLTRLITRGATLKRFVLLGIALGLAALTKVSNLGLIFLATVVFIVLVRNEWKQRRGDAETGGRGDLLRVSVSPRLLFGMPVCAALVILLAFWWYARNWFLYGDFFAFNVWLAIAGARPQPFPLAVLLDEFQGLRISFWGNFGGVNVIAPEWVYVTLDAITIVAIIGLLIGIARRALPRLLALPALWFAIVFVALMRWTTLTYASQGRLMFPAMAAVGVLLAHGLGQFQVSSLKFQSFKVLRLATCDLRPATFSVVIPLLFLLSFSILTPFTLIAPAYALPPRLPDATPAQLTRIVFDAKVELIGHDLPQRAVRPNSQLPITLYWRGLTRITEDFSLSIQLFDAAEKKVGQWDAYPGNGLYPTRLWQPGEIVVDDYRVPLAADARGPQVGRVQVGMYRYATQQNLAARDPQGRAITPRLARFKIAGISDVRVENPVEYVFGEQIALVGYALPQGIARGESVAVKLFWRARAAISDDYTVFVHLVDANGKLVAQRDAEPQRGAYPTSFWDAGEIVADGYEIAIPRDTPPGEYQVRVGLYRAADGMRLPMRGGDYAAVGNVRVIP